MMTPGRFVVVILFSIVLLTSLLLATYSWGFSDGKSKRQAQCNYRDQGALPDRRCTPGAINHAVTQATIHKTICIPGWSAEQRPSVNVTEPEKRISVRQYGYVFGTSMQGYEYDHLIPISLGGALNDTRNMWAEPHHVLVNGLENGSYAKDNTERNLHRLVCNGALKLWQARSVFRIDWRTGD